MRVFQIGSLYEAAKPEFLREFEDFRGMDFQAAIRATILGGFDGSHILGPAFDHDPGFQFVWGNFPAIQALWCRERGFVPKDPLAVVLAQIEEHRAEVLYSLDPQTFDSAFLARLPGCVKKTLCWRAALPGPFDFTRYQVCLSNFPPINQTYEQLGMRTAFFTPSFDPTADQVQAGDGPEIDLCFIGSVTRAHAERIQILTDLARRLRRLDFRLHLLQSRGVRIASLPLVSRLPGNRWALPADIRRIAQPALFGKTMFATMKRSRIVLNISTRVIGGAYRGNMRCFEAMSCGSAFVSDAGIYPEGMVDGENLVVFDQPGQVLERISYLLEHPDVSARIGAAADRLMRTRYSKDNQWREFQDIVAGL